MALSLQNCSSSVFITTFPAKERVSGSMVVMIWASIESIFISSYDHRGIAIDITKKRLKDLRNVYCLGIQIIRVYLTWIVP